jgi:Domain of unknown function (DUF5666)
MSIRMLSRWAACTAACLMVACGGGGDTGGGIGGTGGGGGGGIGGTGVSVGTITAFGSVWVNGVEFSSSGTVIKRDDSTVTQSDLRVGMVARVNGSIAGKSADTISVDSAAKGFVESVNGTTQIVLMGQTITIDGATVIENNQRPAAGDYAEVHGLVVADGQIAAGFIERKAAPATPPFAVKGVVKGHVAGGSNFAIGNLAVTVPSSAITSDMPAGSWNGLQVEVKGTACSGRPVCATLTASKVEPADLQGNIAEAELEGFVTVLNADGFNLGAQKVVTNGSTLFSGGVAGDIVVGTKVEVEGSVSAGVFTAAKVSFRESIRIEALVAAKSGNTLTLTGLSGIAIETNSLTRFKNTPLASINVGNYLRVRGRPGSANNVVATEVEVQNGGNTSRVILQAAASALARPAVTLLGIAIDTSAIGSFKDINDNAITADQFFASTAVGKLIKARGTLGGSTITWNQEIQLED